MRVILLADIKKLGQRGTIATVADGYAQNVLLPQKLAIPATGANLKTHEEGERKKEDKKTYEESLLLMNLKKIDGQTITLNVRANEAGTLFQAIHPKQIAEGIENQLGVLIPEMLVTADEIKKKGEYEVTISKNGMSVNVRVAIA